MTETTKTVPVTTENTGNAPAPQAWAPMDSLRREIDRLFDEFHPMSWRLPFGRGLAARDLPGLNSGFLKNSFAVDLVEKDNGYEITAELPGMDEKDIEVKIANGTLTIKGEKTEEKEEKDKDYYLSERRYGSLQRVFQLPDGVDADKIEANFGKGVLKVTLPKSAEAKKDEKKIEIKAA
jgi:HSP20 family protein